MLKSCTLKPISHLRWSRRPAPAPHASLVTIAHWNFAPLMSFSRWERRSWRCRSFSLKIEVADYRNRKWIEVLKWLMAYRNRKSFDFSNDLRFIQSAKHSKNWMHYYLYNPQGQKIKWLAVCTIRKTFNFFNYLRVVETASDSKNWMTCSFYNPQVIWKNRMSCRLYKQQVIWFFESLTVSTIRNCFCINKGIFIILFYLNLEFQKLWSCRKTLWRWKKHSNISA